MTEQAYLLLTILAVLFTKHLIFDFFLQTASQVKHKGIYGHPLGLLHAAGHALGSCLVFVVMMPRIAIAIGLIVAEFVIHYHLDWLKEKFVARMKLRPDQGAYWWALGTDQWLHQVTYFGMAVILIQSS